MNLSRFCLFHLTVILSELSQKEVLKNYKDLTVEKTQPLAVGPLSPTSLLKKKRKKNHSISEVFTSAFDEEAKKYEDCPDPEKNCDRLLW